MDIVTELAEREKILQLKARYIRFGDLRNWEEWAKCFTEDF